MNWLNEPELYENMGECDFRGCIDFTLDPHCPYYIFGCIFKYDCILSHTG